MKILFAATANTTYDLGSEWRLDLPILEVVPLDRPEEAVVLDRLLAVSDDAA